jgi:N-acetylneuraminic acid mutarotase
LLFYIVNYNLIGIFDNKPIKNSNQTYFNHNQMKIKSLKFIKYFLFLSANIALAQESINTAGNTINNAGSSMSYSIGQVFYSNFETAAGKLEQGVLNNLISNQFTLCSSDTLNQAQGIALTGIESSLVYYANLYLLADNNGNPGLFKFKPSSKTLHTLSTNFTFKKQSALAEYKGKIYCMGGHNNSGSSNSNEVYDIASNTWQVMGNMPVALYACKSFTIGNHIYLMGNTSNGTFYAYQYNPLTNVYTAVSLPSFTRKNAAFTLYQNKIYMVGGTSSFGICNNVDVFDPATGTWNGIAYLPKSLSKAGTSIYDNKMYVFGGTETDSSYSETIFAYDFTTGQWNQSAIAAPGILSPESAQIEQVVYVLGGSQFNGNASNSKLKYYCRENLCQCMW